MEKHAVLVTLDKEFTGRRIRNAIGRHVQLVCDEPDAADLLIRYLDDMLSLLEHYADITIVCKPVEMRMYRGWK